MANPTRIDLKDIGTRHPEGGLIEVRFTNQDGKTEVWMVDPVIDTDRYGNILDLLRAEGVKMAYLDHGVDSRLGLQHDRMNLMLRHIQHHEEEIAGMDRDRGIQTGCSFEETLDAPPAA